MILTCPNCATRYLVEASEMRSEGRKVRCSACGEEWRVSSDDSEGVAEDEPELAEQLAGAPLDPSGPADLSTWAEASPSPLPPAQAEDSLIVAPIATNSRATRTAPRSNGWLLVLLALVILAVCAFAFRRDIVRAWPAAGPVYSALGFPVGPVAPRQ